MNGFDYGIVGFNFQDITIDTAKNYLNFAMGNKLFDYIFSGIVPIVISAKSMEKFVAKEECGFIKHVSESWTSCVSNKNINYSKIESIIDEYCIEEQSKKIANLYESLF